MLPRAAAFLVALLTLNLSAAETLRACSSAAQHEAAAQSPDEHQGHHGASQGAPAEADCEKPSQAQCCTALSSCGPSIAIDADTDSGQLIPDSGPGAVVAAGAPSALERSPEPPPPKA